MNVTDSTTLKIEGIANPTIVAYFETLNSGDFEQTSGLFAINGAMKPPFESPIEGREAIAQYLQTEAKGMVLQPQQGTTLSLEDGCTEVQVRGKVQTPLFGVNVGWQFVLNADQEILLAKIKLLASPQELLKLRR
ncbi:ketosteroid isomerase family protein [Phormidesmis sp. 146-35]